MEISLNSSMREDVLTREAEDAFAFIPEVRFVSGHCVSTKVTAARREKFLEPSVFRSVYPKQSYVDNVLHC